MRDLIETAFVQIEDVGCNSTPWERGPRCRQTALWEFKRCMHGQWNWWLSPAKFANWEVVSEAR